MASERLADAELDEALAYAQGLHSLRLTAAIAELKERRDRDLTGSEIEEIEWLIRRINEGEAGMNPKANHAVVLLGALAKLLAGAAGGGK